MSWSSSSFNDFAVYRRAAGVRRLLRREENSRRTPAARQQFFKDSSRMWRHVFNVSEHSARWKRAATFWKGLLPVRGRRIRVRGITSPVPGGRRHPRSDATDAAVPQAHLHHRRRETLWGAVVRHRRRWGELREIGETRV